MPRFIILTSILLFAFCQDSIEKMREENWFFDNLTKNDESLGNNFDVIGSYSFLSNTNETSCFSPVCAEINFHLQVIHNEYDSKFAEHSEYHLKNLIKNIKETDYKVLNTANYVFIPCNESHFRSSSDPYGYDFKAYKTQDIDYICEKYKNSIFEKTNGMIQDKLDKKILLEKSRLYISTLTFSSEWLRKFDTKANIESDFILANGSTTKREYMNKEAYYLHKEFSKDGSKFTIVVVPYLENTNKNKSSRMMVYLIPEKNDVKQVDLWNNFYELSKENGGIGKNIYTATRKKINLYIPKIEKIESNLDTLVIFKEIFKNAKHNLILSEMKTYLKNTENGTDAASLMKTTFVMGICEDESILVKANVPHIAFIYDSNLDRILFILNDNGPVTKNNY